MKSNLKARCALQLLAIRGIASRRGQSNLFRWTQIREWGTRYASGMVNPDIDEVKYGEALAAVKKMYFNVQA